MDFGDREWVTADRIVPAWNDILQLPLQAVECSLVHVEPLGKLFRCTHLRSFKRGKHVASTWQARGKHVASKLWKYATGIESGNV